jgi:hypothetical protein
MATTSREIHNPEYCAARERLTLELFRNREAQHILRAGTVVAARCDEIRDSLRASSARMQAAAAILGEVAALVRAP